LTPPSPLPPFLLYGAYGYTGALCAEEAVARGHRPLLAGRHRAKLEAIANRLGLDCVVVDLADTAALDQAVAGVRAVLHAAGPYLHTAAPMRAACLRAGVHYLDLTGELDVLAATLSPDVDAQARARGLAVIGGAGFDVVPSDCLAAYVARQVPDPTELHIAIVALGGVSAGTVKSGLEHLDDFGAGYLVRRGGRLQRGHDLSPIQVTFTTRPRTALCRPATWGDLVTAHHALGIPNITTYMALPAGVVRMRRLAAVVLRPRAFRRLALALTGRLVRGPGPHTRATARCHLWARAANARGQAAEARLTTPEAYQLTAYAAVRAVERVIAENPVGALTPSQALGPDFILELPGVART
jgi:short subunit dehydrogenase-like uncharacterized protein